MKVPESAGPGCFISRVGPIPQNVRCSGQLEDAVPFEVGEPQAGVPIQSQVPESVEHAVAGVVGDPQRGAVKHFDESRVAAPGTSCITNFALPASQPRRDLGYPVECWRTVLLYTGGVPAPSDSEEFLSG